MYRGSGRPASVGRSPCRPRWLAPVPHPAPLDGPVQPGVRPRARPVGHSTTRITETVYLHELRPVLEDGAMEMERIFPSVISER